MKILISLLFSVVSTVALAAPVPPVVLDIAKDSAGKPIQMNQQEAIKFCASKGEHLPSGREMAQISMSFGAKGIVTSCGSDSQCYSLNLINADGSSDSFSYSYAGYQIPTTGDMSTWFWSSSRGLYQPPSIGYIAFANEFYFFDLDGGNKYAVGCLSDK